MSSNLWRSIVLEVIIRFTSMTFFTTDLQPANILFSDDCDLSSDILMEPELSPVNWLPKIQIDNSAPQYLVVSQRPRGMLDNAVFSALTVKIGDLGGAMWSGQYDSLPVTPTALRAPELLEKCPWNEKIDIWTLGCLIFQLATNEPLFPLESFGCTADEIHQLLISRLHTFIEGGSDSFAVYLEERLPSDFGTESVEQLVHFLWSMLQENPQDRPSAAALLEHPFLVG
ncbi:serine protein kinase [Penicillium alfredii]|uniref:Serine protein kinase n=1 Tax=Penicillium alfredii TaxID=1506179 RepID=A0A9W9JYY9_9EURO|nr:serine protein kinase [Penicillium alfredii]KAJ5086551.1 serine protein kinase [Penicillium alfredii]